ncbi:uncharacterized protein LOC128193343 [Vigna angularis]|nr:uncharacterized protein LOC128193343 [Vigna angularis]
MVVLYVTSFNVYAIVRVDNYFSYVKDKSGCDATRINPEFVDNNGMTFWKLQSYNDESVLLVQDMKIQDETATLPEESWFVYGLPEKDEIDKYISSRAKRLKSLNSQKSL